MSAPTEQGPQRPARISVSGLVDELEVAAGPLESGSVPVDVLVVEGLEQAVECPLVEHFTEDDVMLLTLRPQLADQVRAYVRGVLNG